MIIEQKKELEDEMMEKISGNQLFVKALIEEGVDTLFAYPGGYAIDIFD